MYDTESNANRVYQNNITNNQNNGVLVDGSYFNAADNIISNNNLIGKRDSGVHMLAASSSSAYGNTIKNSSIGIQLGNGAEGCNATSNVIANCSIGIQLGYLAEGCNATSNVIANCSYGVKVDTSSGHTISGNVITNISQNGIDLYDSSNNAVFANNVTNCYNGIWISKCFRSTFWATR